MMETQENDDPIYRAMVAAFIADKRNRVIPAFGIRKKRIALDTALVQQEFKLIGDFVYVDYNSTGVAECSLNNTSEDSFPLLALAGVQNIPYDGLYITAAAQPGLFINLWYGYNSQFISPTSAIATIGSITNPVKISDFAGNRIDTTPASGIFALANRELIVVEGGAGFGTSFASATLTAAGGTLQVFAAAANTNGAVIGDANASTASAGAHTLALLAKATAPATAADGVLLLNMVPPSINTGAFDSRQNRTRIASGLGLFFFAGALETAGIKGVQYTAL